MKKITKRKIFILIVIVIFINCIFNITYASVTEEEKNELIGVLEEYEEQLGDLQELKEIVDRACDDLNSTNTVNDELRKKISKDIDELSNVSEMNPIVLQTLQIELKAQIENLNDSNIGEVREEMDIIRQWIDSKVLEDQVSNDINNSNIEESNIVVIENYSKVALPKTGEIFTKTTRILIITVTIMVGIILSVKDRKYKDVK